MRDMNVYELEDLAVFPVDFCRLRAPDIVMITGSRLFNTFKNFYDLEDMT